MVYSIVVTYNGAHWIDKCLSSLVTSTVNSHHIIVIDNNSTDATVSIIKEKFASVELIQSDKNLGFGKANNIGMQMALSAGADFVFLLNQDAWVDSSTIENLVSLHHENPDYGILSPMHFNGEGELLDHKVFANVFGNNVGREIVSDLLLDKVQPLYDLKFINAAVWLVPVKCIERIGCFDKAFFHYGEDCNFAQRVIFHNYKIGLSLKGKAYHDREHLYGKSLSMAKYKRIAKSKLLMSLSDVNSKNIFVSYFRGAYYSLLSALNNISEKRLFLSLYDIYLWFVSIFWINRVAKIVNRGKR